MPNTGELSSIATDLQELTARIAAMAEEASATKDEGAAADLFEAERSLRTAARRIARLVAT